MHSSLPNFLPNFLLSLLLTLTPSPSPSPTPSPTPSIGPSPGTSPSADPVAAAAGSSYLKPIGTTVNAGDKNWILLGVGVKAVGQEPISANVNVVLPGNTYGDGSQKECAPWSDALYDWDRQHPSLRTNKYLCRAEVPPGGSAGWGFSVHITGPTAGHDGYVQVEGSTLKAPIVIRTGTPATLPKTGPDAKTFAQLGGGLIVLGAALMIMTLRRARQRQRRP